MNSLGIVARAVLMENGGGREEPAQSSPSRNFRREIGRRAAIGAGVFGLGYGGVKGYQHMMSPLQPRGAKGSLGKHVAGLDAAKLRVGRAGAQIKGAVLGVPGALRNFYGAHSTGVKRAAIGAGAAGLGYGAYKMYQKRAKAAAREAYYNTYMSLMEAAEQEQQRDGFVKRWGKRALVGAGIAAGGAVGASALRGGLMQRGKGAKAIASGVYGGARKMLLHPLRQGQAMTAHAQRILRNWRGKRQPTLPGM
jgi:hypothetical protein